LEMLPSSQYHRPPSAPRPERTTPVSYGGLQRLVKQPSHGCDAEPGSHHDAGGNRSINGIWYRLTESSQANGKIRRHTVTESVRGTDIVSASEGDRPSRQANVRRACWRGPEPDGWRPFQSGDCVSSACAPSVPASLFERARSVWAARVYGSCLF
jgi:hypothetical protein